MPLNVYNFFMILALHLGASIFTGHLSHWQVIFRCRRVTQVTAAAMVGRTFRVFTFEHEGFGCCQIMGARKKHDDCREITHTT